MVIGVAAAATAVQAEIAYDERNLLLVAWADAGDGTAFIVDDVDQYQYGSGPLIKVGAALNPRWSAAIQFLDTQHDSFEFSERQAYLEGLFFDGRVFDFSLRGGAARRDIDGCNDCANLETSQDYLTIGFNMRVNIGRYVLIEAGVENFRNDNNVDNRLYVMPSFGAGGPLAATVSFNFGGETDFIAAGLRYRF